MHKRTRLTPDERKQMILLGSINVALKHGLYNFSIANVSTYLKGVSKSTIRHYYTMNELRTAILIHCMDTEKHPELIAQGIVMNHDALCDMPKSKRQAYMKHV